MIEEDFHEDDYDPDNNWREEEWDALTDGQYGDYPGGDVDYDAFGFGGKSFPKPIWRYFK